MTAYIFLIYHVLPIPHGIVYQIVHISVEQALLEHIPYKLKHTVQFILVYKQIQQL